MTETTYQFKWGKRDDPAHTITQRGEEPPYIDGWVRDMRAGCPWRLLNADTGEVLRQGVGPAAICAECGGAIEPEPRFWSDAGEPVHMLCKP